MYLHTSMTWSLISDLSLEVEWPMSEMSRLEDMVIGINMENGGVMLLGIHGSDTVVEKLLARSFIGVDRFCSLSEPLYHISQSTIITPCVDIRITYAKQ